MSRGGMPFIYILIISDSSNVFSSMGLANLFWNDFISVGKKKPWGDASACARWGPVNLKPRQCQTIYLGCHSRQPHTTPHHVCGVTSTAATYKQAGKEGDAVSHGGLQDMPRLHCTPASGHTCVRSCGPEPYTHYRDKNVDGMFSETCYRSMKLGRLPPESVIKIGMFCSAGVSVWG